MSISKSEVAVLYAAALRADIAENMRVSINEVPKLDEPIAIIVDDVIFMTKNGKLS